MKESLAVGQRQGGQTHDNRNPDSAHRLSSGP
jgi:hypothetical protein